MTTNLKRKFSFIDPAYVKFTNNCAYKMLKETAEKNGISMEYVDVMMAFSHWTYQYTRGYMMVVDLQGSHAMIMPMINYS